jgi:uncharacterized protein with GYD domain
MEGEMPFYMVQAKYDTESYKGLTSSPEDRGATAAKLIEAAGGKLHAFYFAFGEYDTVIIVETPDNVSVAAAVLAALAGGGQSTKTTPLMTREEGIEAMRKAASIASSWIRPGG